jgi:hypothetical protein
MDGIIAGHEHKGQKLQLIYSTSAHVQYFKNPAQYLAH